MVSYFGGNIMSEEKLYSAPRWNDIPQGKTVGHIPLTEEEKKKADKYLEKILNSKSKKD